MLPLALLLSPVFQISVSRRIHIFHAIAVAIAIPKGRVAVAEGLGIVIVGEDAARIRLEHLRDKKPRVRDYH